MGLTLSTNELTAALRARIRERDRNIMTLKKRVKYLEKLLKNKKEIIKNKDKAVSSASMAVFNTKKTARKNIQKANQRTAFHKQKYQLLEHAVKYLNKDESWDNNSSKSLHIEIIIRTIVSYAKLTQDGTISFDEFAFLLTGSQLEFFSIKDLKDRYGNSLRCQVLGNIKRCIEAGFLKKIQRKPLYYITIDGKERLNAILSYIYKEKGTGYAVRREIDEIIAK